MSEHGVIVEFDFAAIDGGLLLYETVKDYLAKLDGIELDCSMEARYLVGRNLQEGLSGLFASVRTKKTVQKAVRELSALIAEKFCERIGNFVPMPSFRNFVKALTDKGVKVILATRTDISAVAGAFQPVMLDGVTLYQDRSTAYGAFEWQTWRRASRDNGIPASATLVVTGSGTGVRSALRTGMGSVAVVHEHVAYQDFGGAHEILRDLSGTTAKTILKLMRI